MPAAADVGATPLDHPGLFDNSPNPYLVLDRGFRIAGANKAYLAIVRRELADLVGRRAFDAFATDPDTERRAVASFERVVRTGQSDTMALLRFQVPRSDAEGGGFTEHCWSITHTPILDAAGEVSQVLQHPIDVTELERLRESVRLGDQDAAARLEPRMSGIFGRAYSVFEQNRTLLDERERLERMFANAPGFIALLEGPDHVFRLANTAYRRLVGRDTIGLPAARALPDAAAQGFVELLDTVYRTGEAHSATGTLYNVQTAPGEPVAERFMDFVYQPIPDENGHTVGIFVEGSDVTERMQAEIGLRESEQFLRSVLASSNDCIKVLDIDANLVFMSEGGQRVMEVSDFNAIAGCPWPDFWQGEGNAAAKTAIEAAKSGVASSFQGYAETMKGNRRFWDVQVAPILGPDGTPERILSVSRDVTALKRAEETQVVLAQELAHRMKNTLAMVQAIVTSTLRNTASIAEAADAITGRLAALSAAQDILTQTSWSAARIEDVVEGVLRPHRPDQDRIRISGPATDLSAQQALGLSLTLHELATNAAKYGALSNATGIVDVEWEHPAAGAFAFAWTERGGPPVRAPTRKGFGSRLLERIVASYFDGTAKLLYEPDGLAFRLQGRVAG